MNQQGLSQEEIEKVLQKAFEKDIKFSDGKVLCSMNTIPLDLAKTAHRMFIEANLGNVRLYPGTKELEDRVIKILTDLMNGQGAHGFMVNGGTEANITALWLARKYSGKTEVIYPVSAHFSIDKAVDLLGLKGAPIDLDENYCMDISQLESSISDNTAAIVAIAGSTELGIIDPVENIAEIAPEDCYLHVDAAFGGLIIPFLKELGYVLPEFDFSIASVDSIAVDPHKMGQSTIPSGALLLREKKLLERIAVDTPYLTMASQSALAGTRSSAAVAATFAALSYHGREGYKNLVKQCMDVTKYFQKRLEESGFNLIIEPVMNIIAIDVKNAAEIEAELASRNWWVSKSRTPSALRFVIMPHVTKETVDNLMPELIDVCRKMNSV